MAEVRIKDIEDHEIDTILADDIDFEGKLTFKKPLMIRGKFKGEINSSSALYVGEKASVEARVEASLVSSKGRIKGDIIGHNRVELSSTAHVDGDITTPDFVVESGCKFNGYCNMGGQKKQGGAPASPTQAGEHQHGPPRPPQSAPSQDSHGPQQQPAKPPVQNGPQQSPGQQQRPNGGPAQQGSGGQSQQGQHGNH